MQEPTILHDGSNLVMFYEGGWTSEAMGRMTCPDTSDPTVPANWTRYAGNPVLGQGGGGLAGDFGTNGIIKVAGTYYAYGWDVALNRTSPLQRATSADGITFGSNGTAIAAGAFGGFTGWANSFIWYDGTFHMLVEGNKSGNKFRLCYATSADGLTYTVQFEVTTLKRPEFDECGGCWMVGPYSGRYFLFYQCGNAGTNTSDLYGAYTTDPTTDAWKLVNDPILVHDGSTYEKQQVADACVFELGGISYMFYAGTDNVTPASYLNVATFNGSLASLIATLV